MKAIAVKVVVTVAAAVAGAAIFGTGTSSAKDPYVGRTYSDVSSRISKNGGTAVISTVVGDTLSTDDCIVTSWRKATYVSDDNFDHDKNYLLSIYCSAKLADAGSPGNSLASAQGRAQKAVEDEAERLNSKRGLEWCAKNPDGCRSFCTKNAGLCSDEVMALI